VSAVDNVIELPVADDDLVRVRPGEYVATYVRHASLVVFRTVKVRVDFRLAAHPDLILSRWYRVQDYRGGRVRAGRHSDIVRELSVAFNRRVRHDRIPVSALENVYVLVEVRDVVSDRKQDALADMNRYSVISRLVERVQ
jgi:hypothetical protein